LFKYSGEFVDPIDPNCWYSLEAAEAGDDWFRLTLCSTEYRDGGSTPAIEIEIYLPEDWEQCHTAVGRLSQGFVTIARVAESFIELLSVDQEARARLSGESAIARSVCDGVCDE
jgi:hypothetical protein